MINLQPYQNPQYFVLLLIALLPLMIGLYHGKRWRGYETIISLVFLFFIFDAQKWPQGVALIGYAVSQIVIVGSYFHYRTNKRYHNRFSIFALAVGLSIVQLVLVKLTPLFAQGRDSIVAFLGISYLTFKTVGMLMEIRDGAIKEFSISKFLHFLLFFPTISSGPIDRYRRFIKDYETVPEQTKYVQLVGKGLHNLFLGFFYKFLLGYVFGTLWLPYLEHLAMLQRHSAPLGISIYLVGVMYCYSMYLFFDFAGYSLFAVGISYLMGIETPINFNKPFLAANLKDFWNRWHMTLSFWFRDYIYMRFVFWAMKHKLLHSRIAMANIGYLLLFLTMGIWHGETWYYIVYGLFHAIGLIVTDAWIRFKKRHAANLPTNKGTKLLAIFLTFNTVCFSFLIFSGFLDQLWFS
ncbi:MAG: D-alanyl-lipoteichoic acid biosynthesis protein DltB [Bombilactobacillus mellifer]|uniref:D-alanyl-lipoteichoic acid biosynthesis protein DltB n=1 Tax=Bombilactobacillus mellifer TaxID=1218492 RepID=UPI0023F21926|nr:D-alanyl-lipoteichoic acid biosynthesis protein DltB [Bombilactobacillus mellifer]MCT6825911.1 D-alanyl-lipoteichoic acid biosynthesis protein DltB [Bombilactobacillus mellifer]MCT6894148.1 D-alanyl-lipoteichoic acid biosynthesis protein DltB [Bombilactobacillus mellifer]